MKITKLPQVGHIGIVVENLEQSSAELKKLYDLDGLDTYYEFVPRRCWAWGTEIPDCKIRICMVNWTDNLKLELLQPLSGNIEHARFLKKYAGGMHHSAYYVDDYDAYREFVLTLGYENIFETETEDERGYRRCLYAALPQTKMIIEILENVKLK